LFTIERGDGLVGFDGGMKEDSRTLGVDCVDCVEEVILCESLSLVMDSWTCLSCGGTLVGCCCG
jgi:hypothetical protein